jgi:hypothetical protein
MLSRRTPGASVRLGQTLRCQPLLNLSRVTLSAETNESVISGQSPAISGTFRHKRASIVDDGRLFCVHIYIFYSLNQPGALLSICTSAGPVRSRWNMSPAEQDALRGKDRKFIWYQLTNLAQSETFYWISYNLFSFLCKCKRCSPCSFFLFRNSFSAAFLCFILEQEPKTGAVAPS